MTSTATPLSTLTSAASHPLSPSPASPTSPPPPPDSHQAEVPQFNLDGTTDYWRDPGEIGTAILGRPTPYRVEAATEEQREGEGAVDEAEATAATARATTTPAMAVRISLLRRVWTATTTVSGPRRRRFIFFTFVGFAELVALIVVAAIAYHQPCDKPLGPYIVMVIVRLAVAFPISFYSSLNQGPTRGNSTPEQRAVWEMTRPVGNERLDRRVRKFADLVSLLSFVLFLFGNYWLISEDTCHATAPVLYKGALVALILSWLWTAEIILYLILVIFFLPFFLLGMRWFGVGEKKNEVGPLSKTEIEKLPKKLFVGILPSKEDATPSSPSAAPADSSSAPPTTNAVGSSATSSPSLNKSDPKLATTSGPSSSVTPAASVHHPSRNKKQWWRLWRRAGSGDGSPSSKSSSRPSSSETSGFVPFPPGVEGILLPASQNSCSICLCEYDLPPLAIDTAAAASWNVEEEVLRVLQCGHAFHAGCLGDWLAVSGRCPLCQRPVLEGKKKGKKEGGGGAPSSGGAEGASGVPSSGGAGADTRV